MVLSKFSDSFWHWPKKADFDDNSYKEIKCCKYCQNVLNSKSIKLICECQLKKQLENHRIDKNLTTTNSHLVLVYLNACLIICMDMQGPHLLILPFEDCPLLYSSQPGLWAWLSRAWSVSIVTIVCVFSVLSWVLALCYVREWWLGWGGLPTQILISNVIQGWLWNNKIWKNNQDRSKGALSPGSNQEPTWVQVRFQLGKSKFELFI